MNMFYVRAVPICLALLLCSIHRAEGRESKANHSFEEKSARSELTKRQSDKAKSDMQSILQQHLIGPNINGAVNLEESNGGSERKRDSLLSFKFGKEGDGSKKNKLQTVGSVIGDIIGVLVSEIARFFGSVVSDVAREVTAHGFVNIFKQIADIAGLTTGPGVGSNNAAPAAHLNTARH